MKAKTDTEQYSDSRADVRGSRPEASGASSLVELSDEQRQVLDCLHGAGMCMTVKQLQARLGIAPDSLQSTLDALLQRELVAKLNTIIPSYAYRYPGVKLYAE